MLTLPREMDSIVRRAADAIANSHRLLHQRNSLLATRHHLTDESMLIVKDLLSEGKHFVRIAAAVQLADERRN